MLLTDILRMSLGRLIDMLPNEDGVVKERTLGSQETTFKLKKVFL